MPFDSPDLNLGGILKDIEVGKIQLPDFQREWKWDDDRIRSLLASIGRGHPVGVLMMLETGGDGTRFAPKPISGARPTPGAPVELLLLDGQQRLTSLYQALASGRPVETVDARGKRLRRWYYVDIAAALADEADLEDAILSIPEDRMIRDDFGRVIVKDYSTIDSECAEEVFPLSTAFDMPAVFAWQGRYLALHPQQPSEASARWNEFYAKVLSQFISYTVPAIVLKKDTPKEAVCTVFEKVNTGGVPLNVFELLTATFAADNFRLKDDWAGRADRLVKHPALRAVESTDFLQAVTLVATWDRRRRYTPLGSGTEKAPGIGCRRKDMLGLSLPEFQRWAEPVTEALIWAAGFLAEEYIFKAADVPYRTQLVPLAAIRVILGKASDDIESRRLLRQWFWCGVMGELYGGTTETRFSRDVEQVPAWVSGGPTPLTVADAVFREQRLMTLRTRNSAAYKGIYALLMRAGSQDWLKAQHLNMATFFDWQVDIHHIFPKAWLAKTNIDAVRRESIVNKTALSRTTNITIGGRAPSEYLGTVQNRTKLSADEVDAVLRTHAIDASFLRRDDFDGFFAARSDALLTLVGEAMGKAPIRDERVTPDVAGEYEVEVEEQEDEPSVEELRSVA